MKKLALIRSYCNNEEKEKFLINNIKKLKNFNFDIAVISFLPLSEEIVKICDFVFFSKENPVLYWPEKAITFWQFFHQNHTHFKLSTCVEDYGYAVLNQIKKASEIFSNYEYDYYYHLEYDTILTRELEYYLNNPCDKLMFPSKRDDTIWNVGSHFMILNKDNLLKLSSLILKEDYLNHNPSGDAYSFLLNLSKIINIPKANILVEDQFFHFKDKNFFNHSLTKDFKFFILKKITTKETVKIVFYECKIEKLIKIQIDDQIIEKNVKQVEIVDLNFFPEENKKVQLIYDDYVFDLSSMIDGIKNNTIEIFHENL